MTDNKSKGNLERKA